MGRTDTLEEFIKKQEKFMEINTAVIRWNM